ncbi:MAG: hypothetical protein JXB17_12680 [Bacteroidales bacterium]|nr:hypothetical protein [Bacteroidales bacterium]
MKKLKLLSFFLVLVSLNSFSQISAGFMSGIGYTNILITSGQPGYINNKYEAGLGYTLGGFVLFRLFREYLFLKSCMDFSEKGTFYNYYFGENNSFKVSRRENVYYLEMPVQLQFRFFPIFKLHAGIYNAVRLNMKPNEDGTYDDSYVAYDGRYDIGYTTGIIFEYKKYMLEASFGKSLRSLGREVYWDENLQKFMKSDDTRFYNQTLFFTFGYKIFTGTKKAKD